jgi:hypothetical protein
VSAIAAVVRRCVFVVMEILTYFLKMRRTLTLLFNQPRVGMQCSESLDEEFGWDCMLGKLCRLAKHWPGHRPSGPRTARLAACDPPEFDWYYGELYGSTSKCAVRVAKKQQLGGR